MQTPTENLIDATQFCIYHNVEISFIHALHQSGLIEIVIVKETVFIPSEQMRHLEKLARLHYDLDINLEGIETIAHLLKKVNELQNEMVAIKNKLRIYEISE